MNNSDEIKYKQEILPKLRGLMQDAQKLGFPCLFVVQVGEVIHQVGDTAGGDPRLNEVTFLLFREEEEAKDAVQTPPKPERNPEIETEINALLTRLPAWYPPRKVEFKPEGYHPGYHLIIDYTVVYHGKNAEEALERTKRYVAERDRNPNLPVGVIDGIYD